MILDTFYILFKTNASEVKKATKEAKAATKEFEDDVDKTDKEVNKLGQSFKSLVAAGVAAAGSLLAARWIEKGVTDTAAFNVQMGRLAKLTSLSATEISAWDAAVSRASGGPVGEFTGWLEQISQELVAMGRGDQIKNILPNLLKLSESWKGLNEQQKLFYASQYKLPADVVLLLDKGPESVRQLVAEQTRLADITKKDTEAALEFQNRVADIHRESQSLFNMLLPSFNFLAEVIQVAQRGLAGMALAIQDIATGNWKHLLTLGKASSDVTGAFVKDKSTEGHGVAYPSSGSSKSPLGVRNNNPGNLRRWGDTPVINGFAHFNSMQEGLDAEQKQLELYGRRGINTLSGIAGTWAPSNENDTAAYLAHLMGHTGYGANQKLDMNDPEVRRKIANAINANENGPTYGDLIGSAQNGIAQADTSRFNTPKSGNSKNTTVNIDKIEVHTQATDADGISKSIGENLSQHLRTTTANYDDGILY